MKFFCIERKYWTLFCIMQTSILDKIQQEIISKVHVGDVFIFYHIVLTDMLDYKNSIWQLICTRTLSQLQHVHCGFDNKYQPMKKHAIKYSYQNKLPFPQERGHPSYKATFLLQKKWPNKGGLLQLKPYLIYLLPNKKCLYPKNLQDRVRQP